MDPLSDALSLLKPRRHVAGGFDFGAGVSLRFGGHEGIKCYSVVSGDCWIALEGDGEPLHLTPGDSFLLLRGKPFRLATDLGAEPVDALPWLASQRRDGGVACLLGGGRCFLVGGFFTFSEGQASRFLGSLPPLVTLRTPADKAAMRASIERMRDELQGRQPGADLVVQDLAHLMMVQALRLHLADPGPERNGWLFALKDPAVGGAMAAMHRAPEQDWTVDRLARLAGMSRTVFAARFKSRVGASPIEYLTLWRMRLAEERLGTTGDSLGEIASSMGYASESAFSTAFKRVMGHSPRRRKAPQAP